MLITSCFALVNKVRLMLLTHTCNQYAVKALLALLSFYAINALVNNNIYTIKENPVTPASLLLIIAAITVASYLLDQFLDFLNYRHLDPVLPEKLSSIYDSEKYAASQLYEKTRIRFGFITATYDLFLILLMLYFKGFAFVDRLSRSITGNEILVILIFFGIILYASDILKLPFSIYSTFVIEEKFGFNKTTPKTFILDHIKGWLVSGIIGGILLAAISWFYLLTGQMFWIYALILFAAFSVFMTMFYSTLIVPLFNKQSPLPDGELKQAIEEFSQKAGFKLDKIFEIDGSKRSTKANAYFSGFGAKKRIVLFDTLIHEMSTEEIVAVLAHEIGHYKKKHIVTGLFIGLVQTGLILFIFSLFVETPLLSIALGAASHGFHLSLITFGILFTPINMLLSIAMNMLSRKNEYEADAFARDNYSGLHLAEALKKLSVKNLSNLTPHPLYVFFHYSHPPVLQRLEALEKK